MCLVFSTLVKRYLAASARFNMSEIFRLKVDIPKSMYPRLFKAIEDTPQRMRSEKIRQLASIAELIEGGVLSGQGQNVMIQDKQKNTEDESVDGNNNNNIDPSDYSDFE